MLRDFQEGIKQIGKHYLVFSRNLKEAIVIEIKSKKMKISEI